MRNKILALQFRINPASVAQEQVCLKREMGDLVDFEFRNVLTGETDFTDPNKLLSAYQGVVLGGSGDLDFDGNRPLEDAVRTASKDLLTKLSSLFEYIFVTDTPTFGICYGHQMLGAFAGAEVRCDPVQKKTKSHTLSLIAEQRHCVLLRDLPDAFDAYYGHKDVLDRVPQGATLLMEGGEECKVPALQYKNNIYTVQFHPELNYQDMLERMSGSLGYLPEGVELETLYKKEVCSNIILRNFAHLVADR